jgi:hypothetical protein
MISESDLDLIAVVDDPETAVDPVLRGLGAVERRGGMFGNADPDLDEDPDIEGTAEGA